MLAGDVATAKTILRDYINATLGFADLAEATCIPSKSLMRMLDGGQPARRQSLRDRQLPAAPRRRTFRDQGLARIASRTSWCTRPRTMRVHSGPLPQGGAEAVAIEARDHFSARDDDRPLD